MAFESLTEKLSKVFKKLRSKGKLSENDVKDSMREIRLVLLEADVNYKIVKDFVAKLTERSIGRDVLNSLTPAQMVVKIVNEELVNLMSSDNSKLNSFKKFPGVIMLCGLQGSGKTTFAGKLANKLKSEGRRPLLVACDIYRPAAIKQLEIIGNNICVAVFNGGTDNPVDIAKRALKYAKDNGNDVMIIDTAGRLHVDQALMSELELMKREIVPDEILLAVDSMTGQDAVNVAKAFNEKLDITGVVLTKLDGDTRGGAALSVKAETNKSIKFVSNGEKIADIEEFKPEAMASRILGMGDILGLIRDAEEAAERDEMQKVCECYAKGSKIDLNDYLDQMNNLERFGTISTFMSKIPGFSKISKRFDNINEQGDLYFKKFKAIIYSLTPAERKRPEIINASRKKRAALGSGTSVEDVNKLLKTLEGSRRIFKKFGITPASSGRGSLMLGKGGVVSKLKKMVKF